MARPTLYRFCKTRIAELEDGQRAHEAECHCYHDCVACAELKTALSVFKLIVKKLVEGEVSAVAIELEDLNENDHRP